jgi:hypothetical protein
VTFGPIPADEPCFHEEIALSFEEEIRHDSRMANFKQLRDLYRFPGFVPLDRVRGVFGDPIAVVISLRRVRKKRSAASVDRRTTATTTNGPDAFAISRAAIGESTFPSCSEGCFARGAAE